MSQLFGLSFVVLGWLFVVRGSLFVDRCSLFVVCGLWFGLRFLVFGFGLWFWSSSLALAQHELPRRFSPGLD